MNLNIIHLLSFILYIVSADRGSSAPSTTILDDNGKAISGTVAQNDEEKTDVNKRKVPTTSYIDSGDAAAEQKGGGGGGGGDRSSPSKAAKASLQDEVSGGGEATGIARNLDRLKAETLRKRTLFDTNFPYGVVYGNGRPIGILKPYPQSFELAPIREVRVPSAADSERYARAANVDDLDDDAATATKPLSLRSRASRYTNERYPEILTNFKIHNKLTKMQENRNHEPMANNHKRDDATKRANATASATVGSGSSSSGSSSPSAVVAPLKLLKKRDVAARDRSEDTIEDIESSLKRIVTQLGLAPEDGASVNVDKRAVVADASGDDALAKDARGLNEDEDLEAGANKIGIRKETHETQSSRAKKEGGSGAGSGAARAKATKGGGKKKKSHKAAIKHEATKEEDEEEDDAAAAVVEQQEEEAYKRASDPAGKEEHEEAAAKLKKATDEESDDEAADSKRSAAVGVGEERKIDNEQDVDASVRARPEKESADAKRFAQQSDDGADTAKRSIVDAIPSKRPIANYQAEGVAYLRGKRQTASTESTDIVKGLESSGELTVSGNKNPLASSHEELEAGSSKAAIVTKKSAKSDDNVRPYDLELEKNIQRKIATIKEQVKREIEALRSKEESRDRQKRNTLLDDELALDPSTIDAESVRPHKRSKRDFGDDTGFDGNDVNECTSTRSAEVAIADKRFVRVRPAREETSTVTTDKPLDKDGIKRDADVPTDARETRRGPDGNQRSAIDDKELASTVVESDALFKNLRSRSNERPAKVSDAGKEFDVAADNDDEKASATCDNAIGVNKRAFDVAGDIDATKVAKKRVKLEAVEERDTCPSSTVKSAETDENSNREKRKKDEKRAERPVQSNNLYAVALKKRELSTAAPAVRRFAIDSDGVEIEEAVQSDNEKPQYATAYKSNVMKRTANAPLQKRTTRQDVAVKPTDGAVKIANGAITITDPSDRPKRTDQIKRNRPIDEPMMGEMARQEDEQRKRRGDDEHAVSANDRPLLSGEGPREKRHGSLHALQSETVKLMAEQKDALKTERKRTPQTYVNNARPLVNEDDDVIVGNARTRRESDSETGRRRRRRRALAESGKITRGKRDERDDSERKLLPKSDSNRAGEMRRDNQSSRNARGTRLSRSGRVKKTKKRRSYATIAHGRRKRSDGAARYYAYRDEDDDDFDGDGGVYVERSLRDDGGSIKKRQTDDDIVGDYERAPFVDESEGGSTRAQNRITKRYSKLHDYVADDVNADAYDYPNNYLYYEGAERYERRKRQDLGEETEEDAVDDGSNVSGGGDDENYAGKRSIKREISMGHARDRKENMRADDTMLGLSDADLFGSLPQSYEGQLTRFKRVKRNGGR